MDIKKLFGTNQTLENDGVWKDLGDGAKIKVARLGNPNNLRVTKELSKPFTIQIQRNKLPDDIQKKIMNESLARTVLVGWSGISYGGSPIDYSVDNAIKLLTEFSDFRDVVFSAANDLTAFQDQQDVEEVKN